MVRVVSSTSAAARLNRAAQFLEQHPPSAEIIVVGASRGAADDLVRRVTGRRGATFGVTRFSFTEIAARLAASTLAAGKRARGTDAGTLAAATRATFDAVTANELEYFGPVA